jgi:3-oxoacyl-[acyl-carrier protein] reductase
MDSGLRDRCAIVCAASKGLGKAAALALGREGARLAICARHSAPLEAASADIAQATGAFVVPIVADLSRRADIDRLIETAADRLGAIDVLVTNGGGPKSAPFEVLTDEDWTAAVDSLLMSAVRLARGVIPHMRGRGRGCIIHITSVSVKQPIDNLVLSNAVRAAVTGLARTMANELARDGIRVNCVAPGYTRTDRVVELSEAAAAREGTTSEAVLRRLETQIPAGRLGTSEEFGQVVAFLASDAAAYVTGVTVQVDGGFVRSIL